MELLYSRFLALVSRTETTFVRYLYHRINWDNRLIAIVGTRGVGKTTMLFQHIKQNYDITSGEVLYAPLDNIWFASHSLLELADEFHKNGGKALFLDEVHKYPNWSREIKNIYDFYPDMKVVFTGSSMLDIHHSGGDLSRRALKYTLYGMSFREHLEWNYNIKTEPIKLETLLKDHVRIASALSQSIKPIMAFKEYLKFGYFPFYKEDVEGYYQRLSEAVNTVIEVDLPTNLDIQYDTIHKIKKLLSIIASLVPFTPNIARLSEQIGTTRPSLLKYIDALEKSQTILILDKEGHGLKRLVKPEKIYLGNTNYSYALAKDHIDTGNLRETFFYNQLNVDHKVKHSPKTDFLVEDHYHFEIGGKNKGKKQIQDLTDAYIVKDNIETGMNNQIPLWLFGLLY